MWHPVIVNQTWHENKSSFFETLMIFFNVADSELMLLSWMKLEKLRWIYLLSYVAIKSFSEEERPVYQVISDMKHGGQDCKISIGSLLCAVVNAKIFCCICPRIFVMMLMCQFHYKCAISINIQNPTNININIFQTCIWNWIISHWHIYIMTNILGQVQQNIYAFTTA